VLAAVALAFADASVVALALPELYIEFQASIPAVSWVLTSYALAVAVAGLAGLVLVRRASSATITAIGAGVFAAASVVAGAAPELTTLIAARVVQGVGGAALVAGSFGVLVPLAGDAGRAARWWAAAGTAGAAIGPALGGAVTQVFDWRAVFVLQAPVAALAVAAAVRAGRRAEHLSIERGRRPAGALTADVALALTFGALVGALFLAVLLLVVVWGLAPLAGAAVVTALPAGTLVARRVGARVSPHGAALGGAATLAGGLATLALLPAISTAWVAGSLAWCGLGFGLLVGVLGPIAVPHAAGVRAATITSTARHLGLVLGLALIAPVLSGAVLAAAERAPLPATQAMLDAPVGGVTKVRLALDIRDELDATPSGEVPDLGGVFARRGAGDDPRLAALAHDIEHAVATVLTRSFRGSFAVAAGLAALAGLVAAVAIERARAVRRQRGLAGALVAGGLLAASLALPAGAVRAGAGDLGSFGLADPCTAPPDPYPGDGLDAAAQRLVLSGLNGAACELGLTREALVLSLEPRSGVDVEWDRATIEDALRSGVQRAISDADQRNTLPGWIASSLSWLVDRVPVSWFLERLGVG
jgi:predicted MFS family arabinose efflux permease